MEPRKNSFKRALLDGRQQIGLWCTLSSAYAIELLAGSGFDWLLIDTEHSPADVVNVMAQLQAVSAYPVAPLVRPAWNDPVLIKRYLDIGAQTLLIPYVQNAEEADRAVQSINYPPAGVRGVSAVTRASGFGRIRNYAGACREDLCLLVQIETIEALNNLEAISQVDGVDGVFIGPADLAASMGLLGQPGHPDVVETIERAIQRIRSCNKPAGVLTSDAGLARRFIAMGTTFTAVGVDAAVLASETLRLSRAFQPE